MLCFLLTRLPLLLQGLFFFQAGGGKEIPSIFTLKDRTVEDFTLSGSLKDVILKGRSMPTAFYSLAFIADVSDLVFQGEGEGEGPGGQRTLLQRRRLPGFRHVHGVRQAGLWKGAAALCR